MLNFRGRGFIKWINNKLPNFFGQIRGIVLFCFLQLNFLLRAWTGNAYEWGSQFQTQKPTWQTRLETVQFSSVQSLSHVQLFVTPWIAARQASLSITNSQFTQTYVHRVGDANNHLILCHPLILLPPTPPSIRAFSNESALCIRWPKYWSFCFNISPSNEHPGLISFRMDWLDLLAVQGTLKSLLQHHSSKASIFWCSAFFTVQLSHPYMTTGKTIALTRQTFVGNVMSLLFNMLSRLVITFLPRSKRLLTSWLQSPSAVILEPPKIKSDAVSTVSPSICHEMMGPDAMILVFWMLSFKTVTANSLHNNQWCYRCFGKKSRGSGGAGINRPVVDSTLHHLASGDQEKRC